MLAYIITKNYMSQARIKDITLNTSVCKKFPFHIYADQCHISIILSTIFHFLIEYFSSGSIYTSIWIENSRYTKYKDELYELDSCPDEVLCEIEDELSPNEHIVMPKYIRTSLILKDDSKSKHHKSLLSEDGIVDKKCYRNSSMDSKQRGERENGTLKIKIEALGLNISDYVHVYGEESLNEQTAVVRSIIEYYNGVFEIDYNPSRININLPISCCSCTKNHTCSAAKAQDHCQLSNVIILIYEKDLLHCQAIDISIQSIGYKTEIITNLDSMEEAIYNNELNEKSFVVYSEVPYPHKDTQIKYIQEFREKKSNTPFIVATNMKDKFSQIDVSCFLEWPITPDKFHKAIILINQEKYCYRIPKRKDTTSLARSMLLTPSISTLDLYVLLVDDSSSIRRLHSKFLREFDGHTFIPIECENGAIAFKTYEEKSGQIVAIIMDSNMPVMNGAESTMRIRKSEMNKYNPPYIVGASGDEPSEHFNLKAGFDEICRKPISKEKFSLMMKNACRVKKIATKANPKK